MKRGKKVGLISVLMIMIMLVSQSIAYAGNINSVNRIATIGDSASGSTGMTRGMLLSSFEVSLSDKGSGKVGIYGGALCHEPMKEIRMNLYLDVWEPSLGDWKQIKSYEFSWNENNTPKDDRNAGVVSFVVSGLERGRDYQLRGIAGATSYSGGHESWDASSGKIQVQSLDNLVTE